MGLWRVLCLTLLMTGISLLVEVHGQSCTGYEGGCDCTERLGRKTVSCGRNELQSDDYETIVEQLPSDIVELEFNAGKQSTLRNETFSSLTQLEKLVVERCAIDTVEMDAFGKLSNLKELHLVTAELAKLPDFVFKDLQSLETLLLSEHFIDELSADMFAGLTSLKTLDLSSNEISSLPNDVFSHLPRLESLNLNGNKLQTLPSTIFHQNTALTNVALGNNKLTEIHPDTFNNSVVLEEVHLERNQLTTMSGAVFASNSQIKLVNLEGNAFICDCLISDFKQWSIMAALSWNAVQSGTCSSPEELKHKNLLNVDPSQLICTTTTTTTTTPSTTTTFLPSTAENASGDNKRPSSPKEVNDGLDDMTKYIIIACSVAAAFLIALTIGITICCCKRSKKKPRQVKYILKPKTEDNVGKLHLNGLDDLGNKLALDSKISQDEVDEYILHANSYPNDSYMPNIMPTETDLDEDLRFSYENTLYSSQPGDAGNDDMRFYNSLSKSIAGASIGRERVTPLSTLHRATPVNRALQGTPTLPSYPPTHRATPVSPYNMADNQPHSPWKDNHMYDYAAYSPQVAPAAVYGTRVAPANVCTETGYPVYYNDVCVAENDGNGKYSTGSADSGVHSSSPAPRPRTPTDFSDHRDHIGSQNSINKKTIKNETYV